MSAQNGGSLVLLYGEQGVQQGGGSFVLQYAPPVVRRRVVASLNAPWAAPTSVATEARIVAAAPAKNDTERRAAWGLGTPVQTQHRAVWGLADAISEATLTAWGRYAARLGQSLQAPWTLARPLERSAQAPWGRYTARPGAQLQALWGVTVKQELEVAAPWGKYAVQAGQERRVLWGLARTASREYWLPWTKYSRQLAPGWGIPSPPGDTTEPTETITIPIKEVYIVENNISLTRVSDGKHIEAEEFTLSLDYASWTWTFSATVDPRHYADVRRFNPLDPVELEASVNGHPVRVLVDNISTERVYRASTLRISGRGISAVLGAPYAPAITYSTGDTLTAQQHAETILTENGVPLGWVLDWAMPDWLIPAGTWAAKGRYAELLNSIAAAAGGYIQPEDTERVLRFLRKYPELPRNWDTVTPHFILPADAVEVEGVRYEDKPVYNGVYIDGQVNGVRVPATTLGTDMTPLAQGVVNPLVTHVDAGRGMAEAILSDVGAQAFIQLKTPVFPASGLIKPGAFVRYVDGTEEKIGLNRSLRIAANHAETWQTLEIETHV